MCRNDRINLHGCTKFPGFCSNCCDHETANAWRDFRLAFVDFALLSLSPTRKKTPLQDLWMVCSRSTAAD